METTNKFVPPHLNAEIYRTDTTGTSSLAYLDYIRQHSDGSILIGSSELTGRYWNGGASVFPHISEAKKLQKAEKRSISLTSGTADGCFIKNSYKVLLCEDSGAVSILSSNVGDNVWNQWREEISVTEHDDAVLSVDCLSPGQEYVTAGTDGNIKVWDISNLICTRNYRAAHSLMIYSVSVRPKSSTSFATGSMDQYVSLWDENIEKPAIDLLKNNCGIRCVQWLDENRLVVGDESGVLNVVDARNPETAIKLSEFPAAVHKIAVHSECDKVAVCCDNKIVTVCRVHEDSKSPVIYHDRHMHSNYVRGLVWDVADKKTLHSVGWNGELKSHNVIWD